MKKVSFTISLLLSLNVFALDYSKRVDCFANWTEAHYDTHRYSGGPHGSSLVVKYQATSFADSGLTFQHLPEGTYVSSKHGRLNITHEVCNGKPYPAQLTITFDDQSTYDADDLLCVCTESRETH